MTATAEPDTPDIRLLLGPGAHLTITLFATDVDPASTLDITPIWATLITYGLTRPHHIARPGTYNGFIDADLGTNGRVQWVNGGGDLNETAAITAVATALSTTNTTDINGFFDELDDHYRRRTIHYLRLALEQLGIPAKTVQRLLDRPRAALHGRSIIDTLMAVRVEPADHDTITTILTRARQRHEATTAAP